MIPVPTTRVPLSMMLGNLRPVSRAGKRSLLSQCIREAGRDRAPQPLSSGGDCLVPRLQYPRSGPLAPIAGFAANGDSARALTAPRLQCAVEAGFGKPGMWPVPATVKLIDTAAVAHGGAVRVGQSAGDRPAHAAPFATAPTRESTPLGQYLPVGRIDANPATTGERDPNMSRRPGL